MKKLFLMFLLCGFVFAFTSCGGGTSTEAQSDETEAVDESAAEDADATEMDEATEDNDSTEMDEMEAESDSTASEG